MKKVIKYLTGGSILGLCSLLIYLLYFLPNQTVLVAPQTKEQIESISSETQSTTATYPETIVGKVVTLKKLSPALFFDYHANFTEDVRKNLEFPVMTFGDMRRDLNAKLEYMEQGLLIVYCFFDNATEHFIGAVAIRDKSIAELGQMSWWIREDFRGGGRATEALYLISKAYFNVHKNINSYTTYIRDWNQASIKGVQKLGFKPTGDTDVKGHGPYHTYEFDREALEKLKSKFE